MDLDIALAFAAPRTHGTLVTIKRDGRPQLSNIAYTLDGSRVRISVTDDRAKTRNLRRDPRASMHVGGDHFYAFVVLEGTVSISDVTTEPGDAVGRELAEIYETIAGAPHPDWDEFHQAMVSEGRVVLTFDVERAYGMIGG
ncbi:MAG: PPOX class F420-dependent oxidoreductase [Actinomycetota bacterium]